MINFYLQIEGCNVPWMVENLIRWIPPVNGRFKLNFDGSKIKNKSVLGWAIRDSNGTIKMTANIHIGNV